jgi:hypothetical protein
MNPFYKRLVLLFAVLALFPSIPLQSAEADLLREIKDREEIEQLLWRYTRALDSFDPEAYVATYTEDGSFGAVKGHDALHKMMVDFRVGRENQAEEGNPPAPMYHATENSWTEFVTRDHVRHHAYWVTYFGANGPDSPARMVAVGRSVDDIVRINGQWLIQSRNVTPAENE